MRGVVGDAGGKVHQSIIRPMSRLIVSSVLIASFCAAGAMAQPGAASINSEPHHKRLLYTNDLRFWDVTLPPGQATQPFVHDYDVATVVIGDGGLDSSEEH